MKTFTRYTGIIYVILSVLGVVAALTSGPAVTWPFVVAGVLGFASLFTYGVNRILSTVTPIT